MQALSFFRSLRVLSLAGVSAWLASCAVTPGDCDPRNANAGFGTKLGCSTRGVYAERVAQKQNILLDEQKTNQLFRQTYAALEQEKNQVGKQRREQQSRSANLNRALTSLLDELRDKAAGNQEVEQKIANLERNLADLNQGNNAASVLQQQHELQKLQNEVQQLEADLGLR